MEPNWIDIINRVLDEERINSSDFDLNRNIILQSDSGFGGDTIMDQKVNINMVSTANVGLILAVDGDAGDQAVNADDYIACSTAASPGDRFEFLSDGTRYFVHGLVADASETPFAQAAG